MQWLFHSCLAARADANHDYVTGYYPTTPWHQGGPALYYDKPSTQVFAAVQLSSATPDIYAARSACEAVCGVLEGGAGVLGLAIGKVGCALGGLREWVQLSSATTLISW